MVRWIVFSGKRFGGLALLLLIVTVPRVRVARRLPLRVLRIAGRFRSRGSTLVRLDRRLGGRLLFGGCPTLLPVPVVRLDRRLGGRLLFGGCPTLLPVPVVRLDPRLGAGLLFGGCPTPLPAPIVGVFPICVVFPLTWLIRHDDSSLAEAGASCRPRYRGVCAISRDLKRQLPHPELRCPPASFPRRVAGVTMQRYVVTSATKYALCRTALSGRRPTCGGSVVR